MCDVGYLCANFGLPRPLCSRLRLDVRDRETSDRQTDVRRQTKASLKAPAYSGRGTISQHADRKFSADRPPLDRRSSRWGGGRIFVLSQMHANAHVRGEALFSIPLPSSVIFFAFLPFSFSVPSDAFARQERRRRLPFHAAIPNDGGFHRFYTDFIHKATHWYFAA